MDDAAAAAVADARPRRPWRATRWPRRRRRSADAYARFSVAARLRRLPGHVRRLRGAPRRASPPILAAPGGWRGRGGLASGAAAASTGPVDPRRPRGRGGGRASTGRSGARAAEALLPAARPTDQQLRGQAARPLRRAGAALRPALERCSPTTARARRRAWAPRRSASRPTRRSAPGCCWPSRPGSRPSRERAARRPASAEDTVDALTLADAYADRLRDREGARAGRPGLRRPDRADLRAADQPRRPRPGCSTSSTAASTTSWWTRRRTPRPTSGTSCAP